ncbi:Major facilitator superfamily (MFS) transporter [hydrothermal vent metagenome]|uniref:Major facilitator superfamily (MFS) transporter n=1 Tax=hydrothermal vent metagenome TaxID=652676 RepID=A0A1W1DCF2_9ZZZZ
MWICGLGLLVIPYTDNVFLWTLEAAVIGAGMAMLYPTLGAAVADFAPVEKRGTLLGIYRFWRDFGYAVAALTLGIVAQMTQALTAPFLLASVAMILSGLYVFLVVPNKVD